MKETQPIGVCNGAMVTFIATVKAILTFLTMVVMTSLVHLLRLLNRCFGIRTNKIDPVVYEDWFSVNLGTQAFQTMLRDIRRDIVCTTKVGELAPNISIFTLDRKEHSLLNFQNSGRPLIVNFGSCS